MNDDLAEVVTLLGTFLRLRDRVPVFSVRLLVGRMVAIRAVARRANAVVPLLLDLLHLAVLEVRARAEHPRDANEREQEEDDLNERLTRVELLLRRDLQRDGDQREESGNRGMG